MSVLSSFYSWPPQKHAKDIRQTALKVRFSGIEFSDRKRKDTEGIQKGNETP